MTECVLFTTLLQFPHHLHPRGTLSHYFSSSSLFITPSFNRTTKILLYHGFLPVSIATNASQQQDRLDKRDPGLPPKPPHRGTIATYLHLLGPLFSAPDSNAQPPSFLENGYHDITRRFHHSSLSIAPQLQIPLANRDPYLRPSTLRPVPTSTVPTLLYRGYSPSPQPDSRPRIQLHHHRASRRNETAETPQPAH